MKKFQPYLDFYKKHSISPVAQNIEDENLIKHLQRREALYRHLGIVPGLLNGKTILEFGPGSGHNAIFTNAQNPARYVLVDGNETGLQEAQKNLAKHGNIEGVEFVHTLIENYKTQTLFDLVLCEALIPFQLDPLSFVKKPGQFVKRGGLFVITCTDSVAVLSDWMRRLYGAILVLNESDFDNRLTILREPFKPHLNSLSGMSRPIDDWLIDNVIQCLDTKLGRGLFSITEAISALADEFDVFQSSPNFSTDWRWYKDIHGEQQNFNEQFKNAYIRNIHSMLDYRTNYSPREPDENRNLISLCDDVFDLIHLMLQTKEVTNPVYIEKLVNKLDELCKDVATFNKDTANAIADFSQFLNSIDSTQRYEFSDFIPFWGRGTQYLSFIKR